MKSDIIFQWLFLILAIMYVGILIGTGLWIRSLEPTFEVKLLGWAVMIGFGTFGLKMFLMGYIVGRLGSHNKRYRKGEK